MNTNYDMFNNIAPFNAPVFNNPVNMTSPMVPTKSYYQGQVIVQPVQQPIGYPALPPSTIQAINETIQTTYALGQDITIPINNEQQNTSINKDKTSKIEENNNKTFNDSINKLTYRQIKANKSEFQYFDIMYNISEALIRIITLNFGFDAKENKVNICADFTAMTKHDKTEILWLADKYGIRVINTPYTVLEFYKNWMLDVFKNIANNIIAANSIYPNNDYEKNVKRKYITDAINGCEILIQIVQMTKILFKCDESKLMYFVELIIRQINRLKHWNSAINKLYKDNIAINNFITKNPSFKDQFSKMKQNDKLRLIEAAKKSECPIKLKDNTSARNFDIT